MNSQQADDLHSDGDNCDPHVPVITFVADDRFVIFLAAAIASLLANAHGEPKLLIFIIDSGVSKRNKDKISQLAAGKRVRLEWLEPTKAQRGLLKSLPIGYVGRPCYYKMFIPELLGSEYSRMIYLDSDVIVEADITELWETDLGDNYVLAVQDLLNPYVSSPFGLMKWREMGRAADDELFNAGLLVINAAKWHRENISQRLVAYLIRNYREVQLCDQDAMNGVFENKWGRLDTRWNVLPYMEMAKNYSLLQSKDHENLLMRAHLLHFCGPCKPSNPFCSHPRKDRFFYYLDMTAWSGWRPPPWLVGTDFLFYYARRLQAMFLRGLCTKR